MRSFSITTALVFSALLGAAALPADDLTLEQALATAKAHNPTLKQALATLEQARERKVQALSAFLPKLGLSAGAAQTGPYGVSSGFSGGGPSSSLGLNGSLNLFNGFADKAALDQAQAALDSAEQDLRVSTASIYYSVEAAWAQLLYSQEQVDTDDQIAARQQQNSAMVKLTVDVGGDNKGSWLQTVAQSVAADANTASAKRALKGAQRSLARVLGQDDFATLKAVGEFPQTQDVPDGDDAKLAETLPTVMKARAALAQAKAALTGSDAAFLPSVNGDAGVGLAGGPWMPQDGSWSLGLSLSWNLFNGFSDAANHGSAAQALLSQEAGLEDALRQGLQAISDARDALANAMDQLKVRQASLDANLVRAEIARAQYGQGLITFTDWDLIESNLISSQQSSLSGRLNAALSIFAWQEALSKGWEP
jgi:outer membrane protein